MATRGHYALCNRCKSGIPLNDTVMIQGVYHSGCAPEFRTADDYRREREEKEREARELARVAKARDGEQIALEVH